MADNPRDPQEFLVAVMCGKVVPSAAQLDAAKTLAKINSIAVGKKQQAAEKAKAAVAGRFAPKAIPTLKVVAR